MWTYAPWLAAIICSAVIVVTRLRTNHLLGHGLGTVPKSVSAFYMGSFLGLVIAFFWAMFSIAWWASLPVLCLYALINIAIPSAASELAKFSGTSQAAYLTAAQQAVEEFKDLPPGKDKSQMVMKRADEIMRSEGWKPRDPQN
jgi:hypothetical protein